MILEPFVISLWNYDGLDCSAHRPSCICHNMWGHHIIPTSFRAGRNTPLCVAQHDHLWQLVISKCWGYKVKVRHRAVWIRNMTWFWTRHFCRWSLQYFLPLLLCPFLTCMLIFHCELKPNWTNFKKMQWENISCPFIRASVANWISCLREAVLRSPAPAAHKLSLNNILNPNLLCHWCVGACVQLVTADDQVAMYEWVWRGECWSSIKHFEGSSWLEKCYINAFHRPVQIYIDYWNFKTAASPAKNLHVWLWSRFNPKRPPQLLLAFQFYIPKH